MTQEHPISPPSLAIIKKWIITNGLTVSIAEASAIASLASRLGADQELAACCEYLTRCAAWEPEDVKEFCDLRRPKPPSLRAQALAELELLRGDANAHGLGFDAPAIRRALESLPE